MKDKIKALAMRRSFQVSTAVALAVGTVAASVGIAGATTPTLTYDPTTALTAFAGNVAGWAGPIIIAVASAMVGLVLLWWGLRYIMSFLHHR